MRRVLKIKHFNVICTLATIVLLLLLCGPIAEAATSGSLSNSNIGLSSSDSNGTWTASGDSISCESVTVKTTTTLTITNNYSSTAVLSFELNGGLTAYGATGSNRTSSITVTKGSTQLFYSYIEGGFLSTNSKNYTQSFTESNAITLAAGESITISLLRSSKNSSNATAYISNLSLIQQQSITLTFNPSSPQVS